MPALKHYLRRAARRCLMPLAARAASAYIAGPELVDALRLSQQLAAGGFASTLGFWDGDGDSPDVVAAHYRAALGATSRLNDNYLSIKFPALGNSRARLESLLAVCQPDYEARGGWGRAGCDRLDSEANALPASDAPVVAIRRHPQRIHFDSLAPDDADDMWAAAIHAARNGEVRISCSLPGRWRRSFSDADAAVAAGIVPRVVKGQWPDPARPDADLRPGFLDVIDRLAGRAPHVAIASHDAALAAEAIHRLRAAGSTCELELLYGLPQRASLALAQREGVPVRFYVPYGKAYLPYCLAQARRQPRLLWWLLRDALHRTF